MGHKQVNKSKTKIQICKNFKGLELITIKPAPLIGLGVAMLCHVKSEKKYDHLVYIWLFNLFFFLKNNNTINSRIFYKLLAQTFHSFILINTYKTNERRIFLCHHYIPSNGSHPFRWKNKKLHMLGCVWSVTSCWSKFWFSPLE